MSGELAVLQQLKGQTGFLRQELIADSRTWAAPANGFYAVHAIGGGGSGAQGPASGDGRAATGGAAGGHAVKRLYIAKDAELTIVVGAGGARPEANTTNGNAGGQTTVTGTGISLEANGGAGGETAAAGAGTVDGASGGTATGGDANYTGGDSGSATVAEVAGCIAGTGGGAVGLISTGYSSGAVSSSAAARGLSGGAGTGGKSGDITLTSTTSRDGKGGNSYGASTDADDSNNSVEPPTIYLDTEQPNERFLSPRSSSNARSSGKGVNGNGGYASAGIFAGSGAEHDNSSGPGGLGGGGGASGFSNVNSNPGKGGQGCVIIEWMEVV